MDLGQPITQEQFAALVGISQQAVSEMLARGTLLRDAPCGAWLLAYCANLREQAAGRATNGDIQLASERARLAREQADRVAMVNAERRKELAPVALLERVLANVGRQIAAILEALPSQLRRQSDKFTAEDLAFLETTIATARNLAANVQLTLEDDDGHAGDPASDPVRPEAA